MKMFNSLKFTILAFILPFNAWTKTDDVIVISKDNTLVLNSIIDYENVGLVITKAKELDQAMRKTVSSRFGLKNKPLYLFLNTPGGSLQLGLELIESLKGLGRPIHTVTLFAASMGFQLVQNLDNRYILKNGLMMSHRARGQFEGEFGGSSPSQMESRYKFWLDRMTELDKQTVSRTNGKQTLESYQKSYTSEMWLTGSDSVDKGYSDKVVSMRCDETLAGVITKEIPFFGILIQYDLDNCPINTAPMNLKIKIPTAEKTKPGIQTAKTVTLEFNNFLSLGGGFGYSCLNSDATFCAKDPHLTLDGIKELKHKFIEQFTNKKVIYTYW